MKTKILVLVNWYVIKTKEELPFVYPYNQHVDGTDFSYVDNWPIEKSVEVKGINNNFFTKVVEMKFLRFYFLQTLGIIHKIQKYDIIISHGAQSALFLALLRTLFGWKKAKHVIIDIGGFKGASTNRFINKIISFAIRSVDKFIVHSSNLIDYYKEYFPEIVDRSKFIKLGIAVDFFNKIEHNIVLTPKNEILSFGSIVRDYKTLISAFVNLNRDDIKLKIIGIKNNNFDFKNKNIEILPYTSIDKLTQEILNSKFIVMPLFDTVYSQGQLSVLEPMSLGKAVITSNVKSTVDYLIDGETSIFYEEQNINSLTDKMKLLIDNPELVSKIGDNARNHIVRELNYNKMRLEMFEFITN